MTVQEILTHFDVGGKYVGCEELTTGNINTTYLVSFVRDGLDKKYILQKINRVVFKDPERVMDNIVRVTEYIRGNLRISGLSTKKFVLRAFTAKEDGRPFVIDNDGEYWRCYRFIENSVTYDVCENLVIIERVGSAFGRFYNCLDGFDASSLYISIPDFHNTRARYDAFDEAVSKDRYKRTSKVKREIDKLFSLREEAIKLQTLLDEGKIPVRVTHNDTKCNNVSFDKTTDEALAVLDLDTVMPGAVAHDFGDAIRFIANTAAEDDADFEKVALDLDKYEAFTKGFVGQVRESLTEEEKKTLNLGAFAMTTELAVRFLTDYLSGNKYFRTRYPGHNVDRTRNQIALAEDILRKKDCVDEILRKYL